MAQRKPSEQTSRPPVRTTYLVSQTWFALRDLTDIALKQHGITGIQYTVLSILASRNNLSPAQLSRRFYVTPQAMGQMLTLLETSGLLNRTEDPANRRILRVTLTKAGLDLVKECDAEMKVIEEDVFSILTAKEITMLRSMLQSVAEHARKDATTSAA
ncbi:MarR family winged helix-turn-helix transcriptional regulator [Noviherbaspirillum saxi]|uniref:MarR family transcriptional regulator n=1 Tax=Noviherbaspirillum saxi TaxID=2320863 RepID=A0A3A3FGL9_9BURK|nr:MarR family transcriptional regulator [Noviherbaspirillum saxi]RJF92267.1 MarR family transcriptional regulator [Noviherbaspirillum saxi]